MLNATQCVILDALIEPMLDDIKEQPQGIALGALNAVIDEDLLAAQRAQFNECDILPTIEYFRKIYYHPYSQNRAEGSPYVAQEEGWVAYEPNGHDNGIEREQTGLLSLTAYNDNTADPVRREDVVNYLDEKFSACRAEVQQGTQVAEAEPVGASSSVLADAPPPRAINVEPSAPPFPAIVIDPIILFTQAVGAFIDDLQAHLQHSQESYDTQATNTFAAALLHAIRRNHWEDLCHHPENHGIPNHPTLLAFLVIYVAEHPYLKPSHLFHAASRQVEHHLLAADANANAPIGAALGVLATAGAYRPLAAERLLMLVTEAELVQTVLNIVDALMDVNASFVGIEVGAAGVYVATWLRHIRKGELAQFNANSEENYGIPREISAQLQEQLREHPELHAVAEQHQDFCHEQLEKPLRMNDVDALRAFVVSSHANTVD